MAIDRHDPKRLFIDVGGAGAGVYDRLCEMGYGNVVRAVNFRLSRSTPLDAASVVLEWRANSRCVQAGALALTKATPSPP
jgi:hypothetical protein